MIHTKNQPFSPLKTTLLSLTLLFLVRPMSAQATWDVLAFQGSIRLGETYLDLATSLKDNQAFTFTNTSDAVLLRRSDASKATIILRPSNPATLVNGKPIPKGETTTIATCRNKTDGIVSDDKSTNNLTVSSACANILHKTKNSVKMSLLYELDDYLEKYSIQKTSGYVLPGMSINPKAPIYSPNLKYQLQFQPSGNLTLFGPGRTKIWSTNISGQKATRCKMNDQGNLVIYGQTEDILWSTGTCTNNEGCGCSYLVLNDDGNLQIKSPSGVIKWQTRTWGGSSNSNTNGHTYQNHAFKLAARTAYNIFTASNDHLLQISPDTQLPRSITIVPFSPSIPSNLYWKIRSQANNLRVLEWNNTIDLGLPLGGQLILPAGHPDKRIKQWDITPANEEGFFYIRSITGEYLEYNVTPKPSVELKPYTGQQNQLWKFEAVH